jgi:soluble lytic murein transglycosylase-like protein
MRIIGQLLQFFICAIALPRLDSRTFSIPKGTMTLFRLAILFFCIAAASGAAQANVYGFVDGDRVSVIISETQPEDSRYVLYKKQLPGQFTDVPDGGAVFEGGRYSSHILAAAAETKVDAALIHAVISVESGYNPSARSSAGAVGLMQLMPGTAKRYGVKNRLDPAQNIQGGARYLRDLKVMFGDNLHLVLAAYNAGEQAVVKYGRRIPPFRETVAYVPKVLQLYRKQRPAG